jgi:recombination protein RecT
MEKRMNVEISKLSPSQQIEQTLSAPAYETSLAERLPKHIPPAKLRRALSLAIAQNPALAQCTQASLIVAAMKCAETGLVPSGAFGHAYLIPFKDQCQFIPGYRGLIDLARRSGKVSVLRAVVVRANDQFRFCEGFEAQIDHQPALDDSPLKYVYSVVKFSDGNFDLEIMTRAQVDAVRARSRSSNNGPWVNDYDEMARKTVLKRHLKRLPLESERLEVALDEDNEVFEQAPSENVPFKAAEVKERLAAMAAEKQLDAPKEPEVEVKARRVKIVDVVEPGSEG